MESIGKKKSSGSSSLLAPGFRFHPTDEELVRYYLRRKVCGKSFRFDAISDVDVYKVEPWDLPCKSKLKTRDLEWYFFSVLDKKYGNGARTNRATEKGYWKTTGKDRAVYHRTQIVGMKKTLVYHSGRAPKGQRTNWVMHEYRLADLELERAGIVQEAIVLCRIFQKSGAGPKNGEQYGAPFVEEEWDIDDELELVSQEEVSEKDDFGDDACLDAHDLLQILGSDVPLDIAAPPFNFQSQDGSYDEETAESFNDTQKLCESKQCDDKNVHDLPAPYDMDVVKPAKHEHVGESSNSGNSDYLNYLLDEPFMDSSDNLQFGDEGFIEANDLSNPVETNNSAIDMLEEYLSFFDANDDEYFTNDPMAMLGSEDLVQNQALILQNELERGTEQAILPIGQFINNHNNDAKSQSDKQEATKTQEDSQYPFIKRASQMLGSIPAPSAFAAEFPPKDAIVRLNSVPQSPSSVHVTAGVIQIGNLNMGGNGAELSSGKHENFNIVLSFGFQRGDDGSASLESRVNVFPGKTVPTISRSWFYFLFLWVFIFSMSFKIGTYVCAN